MKRWIKITLALTGLGLIVGIVITSYLEFQNLTKQKAIYSAKVQEHNEELDMEFDEAVDFVRIVGMETKPVESSNSKYYSDNWGDVLSGSTIEFELKNLTQYQKMKIELRVSGKTKYKKENSFIFASKKFSKTIKTEWFDPSQIVGVDLFFNTYVHPKPTDFGSTLGGLLVDLFATDSSPAKSRQPINPKSVRIEILSIDIEDTKPSFDEYKYSRWLSNLGFD